MLNLQELITRGRFIFYDSPGKLDAYELVNGKRNTADIAKEFHRHINNVRRDLNQIRDSGLIQPVMENGKEVVRNRLPVYEKIPLARTVPASYFLEPVTVAHQSAEVLAIRTSKKDSSRPTRLPIPSETDVLDITRGGENQIYEFKAAGTEASKLTREIGAMLNTHRGGIILYGVDDDGTIVGTDVTRQQLDQPLQNSIKTSISPAAIIELETVDVLGTQVLVIITPPWDRKNVYQHNERILLRKGTNVLAARPEEVKALHEGKYVI